MAFDSLHCALAGIPEEHNEQALAAVNAIGDGTFLKALGALIQQFGGKILPLLPQILTIILSNPGNWQMILQLVLSLLTPVIIPPVPVPVPVVA